MTLEQQEDVLRLTGRLDTITAKDFSRDIEQFMPDGGDLRIDCGGLEYVSSAGLRVLLLVQKTLMVKGGKLILQGMKPEVRNVFDMTGFSNILTLI